MHHPRPRRRRSAPPARVAGRTAGRLALTAAVAASTLATLGPARAEAVVVSNTVPVLVRGTDSAGGQLAGGASDVRISSNGRWMAWSNANGAATYRKDLLSGATVLVSLNDADEPANAFSSVAGISTDGSKVAFITSASNMGQGPTTLKDVYVRDVPAGTTVRANIAVGGGTVAAYGGQASLSDDGKVVAFDGQTGAAIVRTLATGVSERVDLSSSEVPGNGQSDQVTLSSDGRYVAFSTDSSNLVPNDTNGAYDVFVRDRQAGTTERVSVQQGGGQASGGSYQPSISGNGRYVAFLSLAADVVPGDTDGTSDVFRRDRIGLTTVRASLSTGGAQPNQGSYSPIVSDDGRYVTFGTQASNLTLPVNGMKKVVRRDLTQNVTIEIGLNPAKQPGNDGSVPGSTSGDGRSIAFISESSDLVAGDTNAIPDAFVDHVVAIGPLSDLATFAQRQVVDFTAPAGTKAARTADLANGRTSPEHLVVSLAHAPEWGLHRQPVARLYQAFFHREPDLGGLDFWVHRHATGTKLSKIAASFAGSSEFATAYGTVDDASFVTLVYGNVLQRKPDPAGLAHWTAKLEGGMSRGDLMVAFSESSEGGRVLAPEVDSALVGLAMLGAMPPKTLYEQAAAAHRATGVPEGGAAVYIASNQYAALAGP